MWPLERVSLLQSLRLTDSQFNKWIDVRWEKIAEYFKGGTIFPCMSGKFRYNGKNWNCDGETVVECESL